jgi:RNA polymerase sigma-70 factor (ECF subfamily)
MAPNDRQCALGADPAPSQTQSSPEQADAQAAPPVQGLPLEDGALVELLRAQPAAGVATIYDRYGRMVFSLALRIVQDRGAAEEITPDVFLRCWRSIDRYEASQGSLAAWLLAIAHHRAIDELRSRRGKEARREVSEAAILPVAAPEAGFDAALLRGEVKEALELLPPPQRDVIELIFWTGLTRREVAERLQVPLGTVHTRLRLGMEKLRAALDAQSSSE